MMRYVKLLYTNGGFLLREVWKDSNTGRFQLIPARVQSKVVSMLHIDHPYIDKQLRKGNIKPLKTMCKLSGYKIVEILPTAVAYIRVSRVHARENNI